MSKHNRPQESQTMHFRGPDLPPVPILHKSKYEYMSKIMDGMDLRQMALQDEEIESMAESGYELFAIHALSMGQTRLLFRREK